MTYGRDVGAHWHNRGVAYDEALADEIRAALPAGVTARETRMFGGLAFLVGGNMAVAASGQGGLLVRVNPADEPGLIAPGVETMVMRGKPMRGWMRVADAALESEASVQEWVARGVAFAQTLPAK